MNDLMRSTMQSAGMSQQFIDRVLATPADQMWYPSFEEMQSNGVVTSESYGERFAVSWAQSDADVDNVIKKIGDLPWFRTIRELEPTLYAKIIDDFKAAIKSGKSEGEAMSTARASAVGVMAKYFPAASDEALLSLLQNEWIAILNEYRGSNSRACVAFLGEPDSNVNFAREFPGWDVSRTLVIRENVMRTGASLTPIPVDNRAANDDLQKIFRSLAVKYANDLQLLDNENEWMDNSRKVCDMLLAMYQQIAAMHKKRAANVMRFLVTANSKKDRQTATLENSTNSSPLPWPAMSKAAKTQFMRYTNPNYKFSAAVPSNVFVKNETPSSKDRALFVSENGRTKLLLLGKHNPRSYTLAKIYSEWAAEHTATDPGKVVEYKVLRDGWFVVSGRDGPRGFYVKQVLRQETLLLMCLEYDEQDCPLTAQDIGIMSRSFDGKMDESPTATPAQSEDAARRAPEKSQASDTASRKTAPRKAGGRTYTVQSGDTLFSISRKFYKSPMRWKEILDANKQNIRDSKRLTVGQTLTIP